MNHSLINEIAVLGYGIQKDIYNYFIPSEFFALVLIGDFYRIYVTENFLGFPEF